ncbi:hypothetical protein Taro_019523 [Colocasia esculenta]|uniref:Uncharacterized protein n=1 Tax=Colocasia esculenta TaxID=4460 RepID=A0A843UX07_COLES|nr:hypothetical protein [Colocasia esculenta]
MLVVFVLWWCHPVRAGDVFVLLGARRRWSFLREGPNGSALLVEADSRAEGKTVVRTAALSRLQSSRGWSGMPRSFGVLTGAGQSVLFLTASLLVAPKPLGEASRGTVVWPDYGRYSCVLCVLPHSDEMWRFGPGSRIRRRWMHLTGETSQQRQGARGAEEMGR